MGEFVVKLPDAGEGVAEAELVEWHVEVGTKVKADDVLAVIMTDKAAVEICSPVDGPVLWLGAEIGELVAVGSPLVRIEVAGDGNVVAPAPQRARDAAGDTSGVAGKDADPGPVSPDPVQPPPPAGAAPRAASAVAPGSARAPVRREGERPIAAPSVRRRAKDGGVDLRQVRGTGAVGRITHEDLDAWFSGKQAPQAAGARVADISVREIKVVGLRRRIAERMRLAASRIAHITYVEEVDMTELERLRETLNAEAAEGRPRLTVLPFLMRAMVNAIRRQPVMNAHFDDEAGIIAQYGGVHIGVATQTPGGLMVPVARHVEAQDLWQCATEIARLAKQARGGTAKREDLSGSTITISSLGALGGLVTTPVINHPEVAIVGVNRLQTRPVWDGRDVVPRLMMNLSSSFDHRIIDGMDAAVFVQSLKRQLEHPATLFMAE